MSKFVIFEDKKKEWRFRLKANNGKVIATSEGYKRKDGAIDGAIAVMNNAPNAYIVDEKGCSVA